MGAKRVWVALMGGLKGGFWNREENIEARRGGGSDLLRHFDLPLVHYVLSFSEESFLMGVSP